MLSFKQYLEEALKKVGHQMGSNSGGLYHDDQTGEKHYRKEYRNGDQAKAEELTGKIYHKLGIDTFHPKYSHENGKHVISTKWRDDVRPSRDDDYADLSKDQAHQLARMHHGAVLTKNWDIVGTGKDNVMKDKKGNFSSIDHGGAFHFRAQGGHKDYSPDIAEHKSLHGDHDAGDVFNEVKDQHPSAFKDTIHHVKNLDDEAVKKDFKDSGLHNWEDLHKNFQERKKKLLDHYSK